MENVLNVGLVGAGYSANNIATVCKSLPEIKLVAVYNHSLPKAQQFAQKYGIPETYDNFDAFLARKDIEAVIISVAHFMHHPLAKAALMAGKHVLVDKPLALNLKDADDLIAIAREKNLKLGVFLQNRFSPATLRMKEAIEKGRMGKIVQFDVEVLWSRDENYFAESSWRGKLATEGGGCLINQAIHMIDLMCMLAGEVDFLYAQMGTYTHDIEVEDHALTILKFKSGALGCIRASTATLPGFPDRLTVIGAKRTFRKEGDSLTEWEASTPYDKGKTIGVVEHASFNDATTMSRPNHTALLKDFARAVLDNRFPSVTGLIGRQSLEVIRAIYASAKSGMPISFPFKDR
jgi:UDP-N-acetyl-2-amino-2-deoxyglucuronate dehydrogenase